MAPADDRKLLEDWRWVVRRANVAHLRATDTFSTRFVRLGGGATVLAAIVSSTVFATLSKSVDEWVRLAAAVLGLVSAGLAGLNTFLRYGERVEMHRRAARRYGGVVRHIDQLLTCRRDDDLCPEVEKIRAEIDAIDNDAPNVPDYIWVWAVDGVALEQEGLLDDASSHGRRWFDWLRKPEARHRDPAREGRAGPH